MTTSPDLTASDSLWQAVAAHLESFVDAWQDGEHVPNLADHLPPPASPARTFAILELIKVDIEQRLRHGHPQRLVEAYAVDFPEIVHEDGIAEDLIYEEFHLRRAQDSSVGVEEYAARFPQQAEHVRRILGADRPFQTTSMRPVLQIPELATGTSYEDFDILMPLGQGSFAHVYLARQTSMQRLVALKVSLSRGLEPQMLARLDHPHVVRVFDQRVIVENNTRLLYMEYVPGGTLQDALERLRRNPRENWSGRLLLQAVDDILTQRGVSPPNDSLQRERIGRAPWEETVTILGSQIAEALAYASRQGVLHRDLKPANILMSESLLPKLADFNVSDCSQLDGISPASYFGGSLAYMSPEQLEATHPRHPRDPDSLTVASDLYSLGVLLWELAAGNRPFRDTVAPGGWAATLDDMLARRKAGLTEEARRELARHCRGPLLQLLEICLNPNSDARLPSAEQLSHEFRLALEPDAYRLLRGPIQGLQRWIAQYPLWTIIIFVLLPNIVAGWFNYTYNFDAIVQQVPAAAITFRNVSVAINSIAFPLGLVIGIFMCLPTTRLIAVKARQLLTPNDGPVRALPPDPVTIHAPPAGDRSNRKSEPEIECLRLGHRMAQLGMILWTIAGVGFPVTMVIAGAPLTGTHAIHFFGSLVLCGMIGASYPYFGVTAAATSIWYPLLLRPDRWPTESQRPALHWLERISARYLVLAGSVPLLALSLLSLFATTQNRLILILLSLGGLTIVGLVFRLQQGILGNVHRLSAVAAREPRGFAMD